LCDNQHWGETSGRGGIVGNLLNIFGKPQVSVGDKMGKHDCKRSPRGRKEPKQSLAGANIFQIFENSLTVKNGWQGQCVCYPESIPCISYKMHFYKHMRKLSLMRELNDTLRKQSK
jgi:hypothetical protein